jgi:hypothetical protein
MKTTYRGNELPPSPHRADANEYVLHRRLDNIDALPLPPRVKDIAKRADDLINPKGSMQDVAPRRGDNAINISEIDRLDTSEVRSTLLGDEPKAVEELQRLFALPEIEEAPRVQLEGIRVSITDKKPMRVDELDPRIARALNSLQPGEAQPVDKLLELLAGAPLAGAVAVKPTDAGASPEQSTAAQRVLASRYGGNSPIDGPISADDLVWALTAPVSTRFTSTDTTAMSQLLNLVRNKSAELVRVAQLTVGSRTGPAKVEVKVPPLKTEYTMHDGDGAKILRVAEVTITRGQNGLPTRSQIADDRVSIQVPPGGAVFVKKVNRTGGQVAFDEKVVRPADGDWVKVPVEAPSTMWCQVYDAAGKMVANRYFTFTPPVLDETPVTIPAPVMSWIVEHGIAARTETKEVYAEGVRATGQLAASEAKNFKVRVSQGQSFKVHLQALGGSPDMFIAMGRQPTPESHDAKSASFGSAQLAFTAAESGELNILVRAPIGPSSYQLFTRA